MKKTLFILLIAPFATTGSFAQQGTVIPTPLIPGKNNTVLFGVNIPVGEFSQTHFAGIGADYSWSRHRFGKMSEAPKKWVGFTANGGIDYYFGKEETVAGYKYRYGGYIYLHAFGGVIHNFHKKKGLRDFPGLRNITLTAGPAIGLYKGGSDFGLGANWSGSYYINEKFAITPGIMYMKRAKTNALWAAVLKAAYSF